MDNQTECDLCGHIDDRHECECGAEVTEFKRNLVRDLLNQCTKDQQVFFNRIYKSIEDIREDQMDRAYDQCKRTLEKNYDRNSLSNKRFLPDLQG